MCTLEEVNEIWMCKKKTQTHTHTHTTSQMVNNKNYLLFDQQSIGSSEKINSSKYK